ncbi:MAG: hypothetical protein U1E54_00245, partial [Candidatus Levybacteria bacterium]|nr:hypothetical protein [Candidatus Levybacteria bacterium]
MNNKPMVLFDIDYTLFDTDKFKESQLQSYSIYKEVMEMLTELSGMVDMGIFSTGEIEFQKSKLVKTGMMQFFKEHHIHIFSNKDENLIGVLEKYRNSQVFLIDDKLSVLHLAKKHAQDIFTIWVKRGPYALVQEEISGFKPSFVVENLSEVVRIVKS